MNILQFIQKFPDENACQIRFKEQRDKIGIICDKCKCKEHFWFENMLWVNTIISINFQNK